MAVFNNILAGASGQAGGAAAGYEIERSLRFNSSDSAYLSRAIGSAPTSGTTFTVSLWCKRSKLGLSQARIVTMGDGGGGATWFQLQFMSTDQIRIYFSGAGTYYQDTPAVFRDASAWYHILVAVDTTQSTPSNRCKIYINGIQQTSLTGSPIPQSSAISLGSGSTSYISESSNSFDGYLADCFYIDGQALDPTSFGEFDDNGIWQPIEYSGTYGTNGFHLPFSDNSTAAALGDDTSGNNNDWTVNNITVDEGTVIYSSYITTPSNDPYAYLVFDGVDDTQLGVSSGGITWTPTGLFTSGPYVVEARINERRSARVNGGSWVQNTSYSAGTRAWVTLGTVSSISSVEVTNLDTAYAPAGNCGLAAIRVNGVHLANPGTADSLVDSPTNYGTDTGAGGEVRGNYCTWNPLANGGITLINGNLDVSRALASWVASLSTIGVSSGKWYWEHTCTAAQNATNITVVGIAQGNLSLVTMPGFTVNGWVYVSESGNKWNTNIQLSYGATWTNGDVIGVAFDADNGTLTFYKNGVSQGQAYTGLSAGPYFPVISLYGTSSGNTNFGQRAFAYTAPNGYKALCTSNLPTPTIANGSDYMDVALYTGTGATQTISGLGFSPDLVWIKRRSSAISHALLDSMRGANKVIYSNLTAAEDTYIDTLSSFNSDGFTLDSDATWGGVNANSSTYVGWTWDAGSSTVSNTDGSLTSSVRANTTAGFSIISYTGNGAAGATVGHGLGVAPQFIVIKNRDGTNNWNIYHSSIGETKFFQFDKDVASANTAKWNNTAPNSTVITLGTSSGTNNSSSMIAYCFAPVEGYSAFGSYLGNGSSDGPMVFTGFRPRWVMINRYSTGGSWMILDTERNQYNLTNNKLAANSSAEENNNSVVGSGDKNSLDFLSNGFKLRSTNGETNGSGAGFIYAAFAENPFALNARAR